MCNHFLTKQKRNCLLTGKYNGYCRRHTKQPIQPITIRKKLYLQNIIDEEFLKVDKDEEKTYNNATIIGKNLTCELVYNSIGSDLTISLYYSSLQSKHCILMNGMNKNECDDILKQCPSVLVLKDISSEGGEEHLKFILDTIHPKLYKLLLFILCENTIRIVYRKKQFKLITKDTVYGNNFQTSKKKYHNSKILKLFHGSGLQNWYSILKNGLKNYSNTTHQVNGAAYGNGIYFSSSNAMSYVYSMRHRCLQPEKFIWLNSKTITNPNACVLIDCDVIQSKNWEKQSKIFVVTDEKLINPCTLYLV